MASNITDAGKLIQCTFYDQKLVMIAQLQMTTEYYTKSHTTNKVQYNNAIHILLGIQLFWVPYSIWKKRETGLLNY